MKFGVVQSGSATGPFAHGGAWGYQSDSAQGFQLLGHRYYDPEVGRFLTRDPAKDGRNWYVYCDNNPLTAADPDGLLTIAGDTSWPANLAWLAPGNWGSHNGLTKKQVVEMIINTDDDSVGIWGHGSDGRIYVNKDEYLDASDIEFIQRERAKKHKKKFKSFVVNECCSMCDGDLINALLGVSEEVSGFTGLTGFTPRKTWTERLPNHTKLGPGLDGAEAGFKKKKPGKDWGARQ